MLNATMQPPPDIAIEATEELRLTVLAEGDTFNECCDIARVMLGELRRARLVDDADLPHDVVRMYSNVKFQIDGRPQRRMLVVFPEEA